MEDAIESDLGQQPSPATDGGKKDRKKMTLLALCDDMKDELLKYLDDAAVIALGGTCRSLYQYVRQKRPVAWAQAKVALHLASCVGPPVPFRQLLASFGQAARLRFADARSVRYRKPIISVSTNLEHDTVVVVLADGNIYAHHVPNVGFLSPLARAKYAGASAYYPVPQVHYFNHATFAITPPADRRLRGSIHTVLIRRRVTVMLTVSDKYSRQEAYRYQAWQSGMHYVVAGREPGDGPWLFFLIYDLTRAVKGVAGEVINCTDYDLGPSHGIQVNRQGVLDLVRDPGNDRWTVFGTLFRQGKRMPLLDFHSTVPVSLTFSPYGPSSEFLIRRYHPEHGLFGVVRGALRHSSGIVHLDSQSVPVLGPRGPHFRRKSMREPVDGRCFVPLNGGYAQRRNSDARFLEFHRILPFHPYVLDDDDSDESDISEVEDEEDGSDEGEVDEEMAVDD